MTELERHIEHFCQWIWASFTEVQQTETMHRLLDKLEQANVAAENDRRGEALGHIADAIAMVFGESSSDWQNFMQLYFPETLAWREHIVSENLDWLDCGMTQQRATEIMESVAKRTAQLRYSVLLF